MSIAKEASEQCHREYIPEKQWSGHDSQLSRRADFVGLTAWDTQEIKNMLLECEEPNEEAQKIALLGSLSLYLDFINLFIYLLRIFGSRE